MKCFEMLIKCKKMGWIGISPNLGAQNAHYTTSVATSMIPRGVILCLLSHSWYCYDIIPLNKKAHAVVSHFEDLI